MDRDEEMAHDCLNLEFSSGGTWVGRALYNMNYLYLIIYVISVLSRCPEVCAQPVVGNLSLSNCPHRPDDIATLVSQ